ncbi:MAG TPA: hypothetical protein VKC51_11460, partial [Lacunisphaera sp.]|nr:hypothetical protein [Lacunisphaera sp.]
GIGGDGLLQFRAVGAEELERGLQQHIGAEHALLEPPLDAVIAAQERIARGEAPEAAARAAGLAPR